MIRPLGRGGMATVYLAIQENFQREVALKIMAPALSEESTFSERFLREARIVSRLVHPHIVTVHDVGIENGHHYLSMEYIEGHDLKERLPSLNGEQLFRVLKEVAMALDYAGRKGYVHRDVKPENIMIHNIDGRAVLMDFGIARAADSVSTMTRTGTALGTPHYMSPEQARGDAIDGRSDLYSMGVLFYYMLTGRVPYEADSPVAVGIKHVSAALPKLPQELSSYQHLLDKLMAKKPEDRYRNGQELVAALQRADASLIDKHRPQEGFEYLGSHEHTPLRSDQVKVVVPERNSADSSAETGEMQAMASSASLATPQPGEPLHIPKEDLDNRPEPKRGSLVAVAASVSLALVCGAAYYFYQQSAGDDKAVPMQSQTIKPQTAPAPLPAKVSEPVEKAIAAKPVTPAPIPAPVAAEQTDVVVEEVVVEEVVDNAPAVAPAKPAEPIQSGERSVAELLSQAASLDKQPGKIAEQVELYRQVLSLQADNDTAQAALASVKSQGLLNAQQAADAGEYQTAQQQLDSVTAIFPELVDTEQYQQLSQQLAQAQTLATLFAQADEHFDRDRLIKPEGNNAKETFEQILEIDPDSTAARQGLKKITDRYLVLAESSRKKRAYRNAQSMVDNGLSVEPENAALLALQETLSAELKLEQDVQALLALGDELAQQEKWFSTDQDAAVKKYLDVLAMQPGRSEAQTKIAAAVDEFVTDVNGLIAVKDYDIAAEQVALAMRLLPNNEKLKSTVLVLESIKPLIDGLVLSGVAIADQDAPTESSIRADRTLHLSFRYQNLENPTTVFQAVLFDGGRSVQIAGVPVVVVGEEGYTQFRMDRPVEGFADGGYHLDIMLAGETIFTYGFVISK
ncbi:serine/threonine-protein kinase [Oceanicoccus sagamiensis]|uniref:non-specific serine/threonine protein kinase n=1 Tax=Oceanicoccus sagamiensis TaxID=716816 RepID=A0A1X9N923_9GAMM|nr:serine/threonine-protein kinase [Oceanicoccus sagamiensis]ARN74560.1 hypothetical protein BST96_10770 [Oceanicoccus sagamiensis]